MVETGEREETPGMVKAEEDEDDNNDNDEGEGCICVDILLLERLGVLVREEEKYEDGEGGMVGCEEVVWRKFATGTSD